MRRLRGVVDRISGAFAIIGALSASVLMVAITIDVSSRQIFNRSVPGMVELSETLLIFLVFLGVAQAERTKTHIRLTIVIDRLPPRIAGVVLTISFALAMLIVAWMTVETADRAIDAIQRLEYRLGLLRWPLWPARAILPLGLSVLTLQLFFRMTDAIDLARGRRGRSQDEDQATSPLTEID